MNEENCYKVKQELHDLINKMKEEGIPGVEVIYTGIYFFMTILIGGTPTPLSAFNLMTGAFDAACKSCDETNQRIEKAMELPDPPEYTIKQFMKE